MRQFSIQLICSAVGGRVEGKHSGQNQIAHLHVPLTRRPGKKGFILWGKWRGRQFRQSFREFIDIENCKLRVVCEILNE